MKAVGLLIALIMLTVAAAQAASKEVTIHFDPSRLGKETRGEATQFTYDSENCRYVEHCKGAPVLPCIQINVVVPKNAQYKDCRVRAASQRLRGLHRFYCRTRNEQVQNSARRFPEKIVEFAGAGTIEGYRVFIFRAYPVMCQPGDGSASCVLQAKLYIEYENLDGKGEYPPAKAAQLASVKRMVINPDDVDRFTRSSAGGGSGLDNGGHNQGMFATRIRDRRPADNSYTHGDDEDAEGGVLAFIKENVYISEDNDIVYAPFQF